MVVGSRCGSLAATDHQLPAIWLQGFNKAIQHSTDLGDAIEYARVVILPYEPEAACDFKLNFYLALRSQSDIEMIKKRSPVSCDVSLRRCWKELTPRRV